MKLFWDGSVLDEICTFGMKVVLDELVFYANPALCCVLCVVCCMLCVVCRAFQPSGRRHLHTNTDNMVDRPGLGDRPKWELAEVD